ncbi:MAG: DNA-binding response regulator [Chloroflexi bacterium RBG_16_57_8]|nr:MAG: DNA-binding response regulator [Chloroflexi bacterium RBG_16_57_8]
MLKEKIRVLIADDHAIVREGIHAILSAQPDVQVVGQAADGYEAVTMSEELGPDIVLMDITMPRMNGLEATRRIKQLHPDVKVLVLTMHESDDYFYKILEDGASGYFVKGGSTSELISALKAVWQGDVFIYPSMAKKLLSDYLRRVKTGQDAEQYNSLTDRQREILKLIAEGRTNQEIAGILFLSPTTVQTHRAHIMARLELHNRTELIKYALRHGFITLDT